MPTPRSLCQQRANRRLIRFSVACAAEVPDLLAILRVKERSGNRSGPAGHDGLREGVLVALLLAIVRKYWFITRQETPHQNQVAILIEVHAHHLQSLRRVLLCQLIEHGIFVAARLAPGRPE